LSGERKLILVTNDDGIASPGLQAAVRAAASLGEPFVVAPQRQWSGAGRSIPSGSGREVHPYPFELDGREVTAYQVDGTPAMAVTRALLELVPRLPALLISGINYGENLGSDVTISGTVGAALQGAVLGVPALAVLYRLLRRRITLPRMMLISLLPSILPACSAGGCWAGRFRLMWM